VRNGVVGRGHAGWTAPGIRGWGGGIRGWLSTTRGFHRWSGCEISDTGEEEAAESANADAQ
jgi:hypothetical protein